MSRFVNKDVVITALNEYGEGCFRAKFETVKIPRAVPGDRVRARWEATGKPFVAGTQEKLLAPSALRVEPGCRSFEDGCGGCQWLHIDYAAQLEWKRKVLLDVLARRAGLQLDAEAVRGMEQPFGYRNKMSLVNKGGRLGFFRDHSHELLVPSSCRVSLPILERVWARLKNIEVPEEVLQVHLRGGYNALSGSASALRPSGTELNLSGTGSDSLETVGTVLGPGRAAEQGASEPDAGSRSSGTSPLGSVSRPLGTVLEAAPGGVGLCLFVKRMSPRVQAYAEKLQTLPGIVGIGIESYRSYELFSGQAYVEAVYPEGPACRGLRYRIPHNGFFQTNYPQAAVLRDLAFGAMQAEGKARALDLYCGAGFFSLALAGAFGQVLGIESNRNSVAEAGKNAELNRLKGLEFRAVAADRGLRELKPGAFDRALLDPPRSGCEEEVLRELLRLRPERLVYVSCSPESLARDLKVLAGPGGPYRVEKLQPVDMFPHTFHLETVVALVRKR